MRTASRFLLGLVALWPLLIVGCLLIVLWLAVSALINAGADALKRVP